MLWPRSGGDVMDIALAGKVAIVEAIEQDYEDKVHLSVTLEDDPGRDEGLADGGIEISRARSRRAPGLVSTTARPPGSLVHGRECTFRGRVLAARPEGARRAVIAATPTAAIPREWTVYFGMRNKLSIGPGNRPEREGDTGAFRGPALPCPIPAGVG